MVLISLSFFAFTVYFLTSHGYILLKWWHFNIECGYIVAQYLAKKILLPHSYFTIHTTHPQLRKQGSSREANIYL